MTRYHEPSYAKARNKKYELTEFIWGSGWDGMQCFYAFGVEFNRVHRLGRYGPGRAVLLAATRTGYSDRCTVQRTALHYTAPFRCYPALPSQPSRCPCVLCTAHNAQLTCRWKRCRAVWDKEGWWTIVVVYSVPWCLYSIIIFTFFSLSEEFLKLTDPTGTCSFYSWCL